MRQMITTRSPEVIRIVERKEAIDRYRSTWAELKRKGFGVYPGGFPYMPVEDRLFSDVLEDGEWKGQRCFIIGGGPSLRGFDFSRLKGELVIGINRAYEMIDCTIAFSMDSRYHNWIIHDRLSGQAREKFYNFRGYKVWLNSARYPYPKDIFLLNCIGSAGFSWSLKDGLAGGCNSGYAALNLAVCLGANPIYLLGFDMKGEGNKQSWWHDGYPGKQPATVYQKFKTYFEKIAPELKQRGIRVINLNPESALKCFEFGTFDSIKPIKRPVVISYYTKATGYEEEVQGLISSLRRFNLEYDIEAIDSLGSWQKNTYYKAEFIRKKLTQHSGRDVLWLDVDVVLRRYPFLFNDMKADFAIHYIEWEKYGRAVRRELNTSVMYMANNTRVKKLIDMWIAENRRKIDSGIWEQKNLQNILESYEGLDIYHLPATYCKIHDLMAKVENPVIELFQASRKFRKEVGAWDAKS